MRPTIEAVKEVANLTGIILVEDTADNILNIWAGKFPTGTFIGEIETENAAFDAAEFEELKLALRNFGFEDFDMFMDWDLKMERV